MVAAVRNFLGAGCIAINERKFGGGAAEMWGEIFGAVHVVYGISSTPTSVLFQDRHAKAVCAPPPP